MNKQAIPPGPKGLPVLGSALEWRRDPLGFARKLHQTYGDMATIYVRHTPVIALFSPELIYYVLVENARNFYKRASDINLLQVLGEGLLLANGEEHRRQRRLVQPAFHKRRVEAFAGMMVEHARELMEDWHPGAEIDIFPAMMALTIRVVAKALFNVDTREQSAELGRNFTYVIEHPVRRLRLDLPFTYYGRRMAVLRQLNAFVYDLIAQRRAEGRDMGDVLSMLLRVQDEGVAMTDKQIRDQVMTLLAAGHDTTTTALTWTFYLLSEHPDVRKKVLAELRAVLNGRDPTLEDAPHLTYLDWVIYESMRLYSPAWQIARRSVDAFDLGGYHFPARTKIIAFQWVTHYLPEVWGDPEVFRPERWDPANGQKVPQGAYFPFGAGPRMCIGMSFALLEAKLVLATILQRYTPRLVPGHPIALNPRITLRPKYGMRMILDPTPSLVTAPAAEPAPTQV